MGWYIQEDFASPTEWEDQSDSTSPKSWFAPVNVGFLEASEDPFDLNVKAEDFDLVAAERVQASEIDWGIDSEPTHLWSTEDEPSVDDTNWYFEAEPTIFYWFDIPEPDVFYWTGYSDPLTAFYPALEPSHLWTEFYMAPDWFYIEAVPDEDLWYIFEEPV